MVTQLVEGDRFSFTEIGFARFVQFCEQRISGFDKSLELTMRGYSSAAIEAFEGCKAGELLVYEVPEALSVSHQAEAFYPDSEDLLVFVPYADLAGSARSTRLAGHQMAEALDWFVSHADDPHFDSRAEEDEWAQAITMAREAVGGWRRLREEPTTEVSE